MCAIFINKIPFRLYGFKGLFQTIYLELYTLVLASSGLEVLSVILENCIFFIYS